MDRNIFKTLSTLMLLSVDGLMIALSFLSAYWIRFFSPFKPIIDRVIGDRWTPPPLEPYLQALPLIAFIWLLVFIITGLYRSKRGGSRIEEFYYVVKAAFLSMLIVVAAGFWYRGFSYSRSIAFIAMFVAILSVSLSRFSIRQIQSLLLSPTACFPDFLPREQVTQTWENHLSGQDHSTLLGRYLTFEVFLQQHFEKRWRSAEQDH